MIPRSRNHQLRDQPPMEQRDDAAPDATMTTTLAKYQGLRQKWDERSCIKKTKGTPHNEGSRSAEKQHGDATTEGSSTACTGPGQAVEASPPAASPKMSAPSISPTYLPPMYV